MGRRPSLDLTTIGGTVGLRVATSWTHMPCDDAVHAGAERFEADLTASGIEGSGQDCSAVLLDIPFNAHLIVTCRRVLDEAREASGTYTFYENDGALVDAAFEISTPQEAL